MASSHLGRIAIAGAAVLGLVGLIAACDDHNGDGWGDDGYGRHHGQQQCMNVVQQCRTICDYYCDSFQCYPECGDDCYNVCADDADGGIASDAATITADGGSVVDASPPADAGSGTGVLCTNCISNADCESGALCILRGGVRDASADDSGAPVGRGFCGHECTTSDDCPDQFLCSQIGSTRQCLPTGNACQ